MFGSDIAILLPEIILSVFAMAGLIAAVYTSKDGMAPVLVWMTAGLLALVGFFIGFTGEGTEVAFDGMFINDGFARFAKVVILLAAAAILVVGKDYMKRDDLLRFEYPMLIVLASVGMMVMVSAGDLMTLYMGLELQSLSLYVVAAMRRDSVRSTEAGLKYFVLGALSSGLLLYGASLTYGFAGTTSFSGIVDAVSGGASLGLVFGLVFMFAGLAFKVSAAPFHMWTPDVYQGAPSQVTAFMASVGKTAAFGAMIRVLVIALPVYRDDWQPIVWVLALLSLVIGSLLAVIQDDVKRMLAYSSVSHAGFILVGLEAAAHTAGEVDPGPGMPEMMLYLFVYSIIVVGSFGVVTVVTRDGDTSLSRFAGLAKRKPSLALAFTVLLLAQAGVPFTTGFVAKFGVIEAAVDVGSYAIAIVAMVVAPMLLGQDSIFGYLQKMNGLYFIPILLVMVMGLLSKRVPAWSANLALVMGFVLIALGYFVPALAEKVAQMHEFHFLGAVFALLLAIMALSRWIKPMDQPWEHHHSGDVDLTPWKWAKPMGIGLAVAVLLLYMAFADTSVL